MQIYTDEFMKAIDKIERDVEVAISEWINEISNDSMIDCRNISIGDSVRFAGDFIVIPETHKVDISNEIRCSRKDTIEDVSKRVCSLARKSLQELIEKQIEDSETPVTKAKDVRKFIKVVFESAMIESNGETLCLRIGVKEYKKCHDVGAVNLDEYQKEASNIQLKTHGQLATINHNDMNEKFYEKLDKEGISYESFDEAYQKVNDYYSKNYQDNKEEADDRFIEKTIDDMKRLIEIANLIKQLEEEE